MHTLRHILMVLAALVLAGPASLHATSPDGMEPKREFRGAWLHIVGNYEMRTMSQADIRDWLYKTLDDLKSSGCNAVFFQVRPQADAFYPSELEPWTRYLTGEQGKAPDPLWDPLKYMIEQCHARGMELHAWLNPYRVTSSTKEKLAEGHIYNRKPELFKRYGSQIYFDPGKPESRQQVVAVVKDIVTRYDVDGIHFDDYFYPYPENGKDFPDADTFAEYGPAQGFGKSQKADWRRHNTALLVHEVNEAVKSIKPWVRFGVSPFGIHRNLSDTPDGSGSATNGLSCYHSLYADAPGWAEAGDVDYLVPQLYWKIGHKLADYETLVRWWDAQDLKGHLYIGQSIETLGERDLKDPSKNQTGRKVELTRELPHVCGNVWWPGWSISSDVNGIAKDLSSQYQRHTALLPAYSNIDDTAPDPVKEIWLRRGKGIIRWNVEPTDDPLQEMHFYVIYKFSEEEAPDISDPSHIIAVTRDNWLFPDMTEHCRYVVTVVDRCWNESAPSEVIDIFQ